MHIDRLIIALNKYWRPISEKYFWHRMDMPGVQDAVVCAKFPEDVVDYVFEKKRTPFEVMT